MSHRHRLYARLLKLYPSDYRRTYGPQMLQTLDDMLDDHPDGMGRFLLWVRVALDLPVSIVKVQLQYAGAQLLHDSPKQIAGSSLLSVLLLVPFFLTVIANELDRLMYNRDLYGSWLWHMPLLAIWVLWLPAASLCVALCSLTAYASQQKPGSRHKRLIDVSRVWPLLVPAAVACGILFLVFFHDSAHCWVQNPVYYVTRFHKTLECTRNGSSFAW